MKKMIMILLSVAVMCTGGCGTVKRAVPDGMIMAKESDSTEKDGFIRNITPEEEGAEPDKAATRDISEESGHSLEVPAEPKGKKPAVGRSNAKTGQDEKSTVKDTDCQSSASADGEAKQKEQQKACKPSGQPLSNKSEEASKNTAQDPSKPSGGREDKQEETKQTHSEHKTMTEQPQSQQAEPELRLQAEAKGYSPQNVVSLATAKTKAYGKITLTDNLDSLLADGTITQEEYNEYYPYDGAGYYSVFVQTDLNRASTTSGRSLSSEDAIAQYIADMLGLESGPYFLIEYAGTYSTGGEEFYEFRCYRA